MATLQSKTGKATVQVSPDGFSVIFGNKDGLQIWWPASDWASAAQFVRHEIERIKTDGFRPPMTEEEVDAEANEAVDRMRRPRISDLTLEQSKKLNKVIPSPIRRKE